MKTTGGGWRVEGGGWRVERGAREGTRRPQIKGKHIWKIERNTALPNKVMQVFAKVVGGTSHVYSTSVCACTTKHL